jgi:hypothetical protein
MKLFEAFRELIEDLVVGSIVFFAEMKQPFLMKKLLPSYSVMVNCDIDINFSACHSKT